MCTAISWGKYFGRNFDYYFDYGQVPVITPRNFEYGNNIARCRYALLGMAVVSDGYPLYFDAVNEKGLSMAALEYPGFCKYNKPAGNLKNIASYELIPWVLGQCSDTSQVKELVQNLNITDESFSQDMTASSLHWIISDKDNTCTLEQNERGLTLSDNPAGVLTNSPSFDVQMINLARYGNMSAKNSCDIFCGKIPTQAYSNGTGAIGLPGDFSSMSRFVKACFVKSNAVYSDDENERVCNFFRMLGSVVQINGCILTEKGNMQTFYSSCCDMEKCIYYYITNTSWKINAVDMQDFDLNSTCIKLFA